MYFIFFIFSNQNGGGPGPVRPGLGPGPACRHFGSKMWKKYELNARIIWNTCDFAILHIISIFISYFLHISRRMFFILFSHFLDFAFEAFSVGVATYKPRRLWKHLMKFYACVASTAFSLFTMRFQLPDWVLPGLSMETGGPESRIQHPGSCELLISLWMLHI